MRKIVKPITYILMIIPMLMLTNCNKGSVKIHGIINIIENCSAPYIVDFKPDAEYGSGDVHFEWKFGDGTSSTDRTPVHVYEKPGVYNVVLKITNKKTTEMKSLNLDLSAETVPIISDFDVAISSENTWVPVDVAFYNKSQHATDFLWNFDDGYTSDVETPIHTFIEPGNYLVTLSAICSGDTAYYDKVINILPPPRNIYIEDVAVWLPENNLGANILCVARYDIFTVEESPVAKGISGYPVMLPIREEIFQFHGVYDDRSLIFEIWEENNMKAPITYFRIPTHRLPAMHYPRILELDNGNARIEVKLSYSVDKKSSK